MIMIWKNRYKDLLKIKLKSNQNLKIVNKKYLKAKSLLFRFKNLNH